MFSSQSEDIFLTGPLGRAAGSPLMRSRVIDCGLLTCGPGLLHLPQGLEPERLMRVFRAMSNESSECTKALCFPMGRIMDQDKQK